MAKEPTVRARLRELNHEREKLLTRVKDAALVAIRGALTDLEEIGVHYHLVEGHAPNPTRPTRGGTHTVRNQPCSICGFQTDPPHDGRAHRSQGAKKKPFTSAELTAKGLTKVANAAG